MASHKAGDDALAELAAERMELAFLRLKMRMDPDRIAQAEREANRLRAPSSGISSRPSIDSEVKSSFCLNSFVARSTAARA